MLKKLLLALAILLALATTSLAQNGAEFELVTAQTNESITDVILVDNGCGLLFSSGSWHFDGQYDFSLRGLEVDLEEEPAEIDYIANSNWTSPASSRGPLGGTSGIDLTLEEDTFIALRKNGAEFNLVTVTTNDGSVYITLMDNGCGLLFSSGSWHFDGQYDFSLRGLEVDLEEEPAEIDYIANSNWTSPASSRGPLGGTSGIDLTLEEDTFIALRKNEGSTAINTAGCPTIGWEVQVTQEVNVRTTPASTDIVAVIPQGTWVEIVGTCIRAEFNGQNWLWVQIELGFIIVDALPGWQSFSDNNGNGNGGGGNTVRAPRVQNPIGDGGTITFVEGDEVVVTNTWCNASSPIGVQPHLVIVINNTTPDGTITLQPGCNGDAFIYSLDEYELSEIATEARAHAANYNTVAMGFGVDPFDENEWRRFR